MGLSATMGLIAEAHTKLNRFIKVIKLHEVDLCRLADVEGPNHPRTIPTLNKLAEYYNRLGKYLRGISTRGLIFRTVVVERSKVAFGKSDPRSLECMEQLTYDL